jgi:putative NIF3 family GTP cyclohydrolase 1 type 2
VILKAGIASDALADLVSALDTYFRLPDVESDARWYPDEEPYWRAYVEPEWVERRNGLMVRGDAEVERAATCVFPSVGIVAGLEPRTLLFAEHPVDLEDEPGFLPLPQETFEAMKRRGISFYHVHGPLDQHPEVSPSRLIAEGLALGETEEYFPIVDGIPGGAAVIGESDLTLAELAERLRALLGSEVPVQVLSRPHAEAGRVAIAAGGGAQREILEASLERGCRTYVTGNAATRCRLRFVQEEVRDFHALAREAGVAVVDGTHYGTEKPPQLAMVEWFRKRGLAAEFLPDGPK